MALFVIVFSLNMFDKMTETINNVKPIKKLCFFIMLVVFQSKYKDCNINNQPYLL